MSKKDSISSDAIASAQPVQPKNHMMSFASVAAMATQDVPAKPDLGIFSGSDSSHVVASPTSNAFASEQALLADGVDLGLAASLTRLEIKDGQALVPDVLDHEFQAPLQLRTRLLDDEKTHLSFASNRAPSLDGKSVASGTTFAMDEKESIRPDDSASVKTAEDDDCNSGPVSGAPNSRVGSEAGGKAFNSQFLEISERFGPGPLRSIPGVAARRAVPSTAEELRRGPISSPNTMAVPVTGIPRADACLPNSVPSPYIYQAPDEKILEALDSHKDRMFLLHLEQLVITFIRDSTEPVLNLPPCNSFCRLLAHRLGDYYALDHVVDNSQSAVQLHRTPHCQLRPPLGTFPSKLNPTGDLNSALPSMKIMRRAGIGGDDGSGFNTTDNSVGPSKAGSETGDDNHRSSGFTSPADSTSTKDKKAVSREEREAKYKIARERIFADWKESENAEANVQDGSNEASRASSTNGKKKKRNKNSSDDGFDVRSNYNAYYPPGPAQRQQAPNMDPTAASMYAYNNAYIQNSQALQSGYQQPYSQAYPQMSLPQMQGYQVPIQSQSQVPASPGLYNQQKIQQQYPNYGSQMQTPYYPQMPQHGQIMPQQPGMASPTSHQAQLARQQSQFPDQTWGQNSSQSSYQVYPTPISPYQPQAQITIAPMNASTTPYPYGQLPYQVGSQNARPMHPVPGSYNRPSQYDSPGKGPLDSTIFRAPSGGAIGVSLNNFSSHVPQMVSAQQFPANYSNQNSSPRRNGGATQQSQSPGHSTLSKWGSSSLPPKPPAPAMAAIGNTSGVPTFQNGTYSQPAKS